MCLTHIIGTGEYNNKSIQTYHTSTHTTTTTTTTTTSTSFISCSKGYNLYLVFIRSSFSYSCYLLYIPYTNVNKMYTCNLTSAMKKLKNIGGRRHVLYFFFNVGFHAGHTNNFFIVYELLSWSLKERR